MREGYTPLMDTFLNAESTMVILFIIIALGFLARKLNIMGDAFDTTLSKVIMQITCPAMILNSVLSNPNLPDNQTIGMILLISCVTYVAVFVVALLLPRLMRAPKNSIGVHEFVIAFGNTGFIGFAVLGAILGEQSVLYAAVYNIPYNVLLFSVGTIMMTSSGSIEVSPEEKRSNIIHSLISPVMIACMVALVLALLHISDFGIVGKTCSMLGAMTPPAAMLVIGSTMAKFDLQTMFGNARSYVTTFGRLMIVPLVVFYVGGFMTTDAYLLAAITLVSAMPVATVGTIMSLMYGSDLTTMSQCTFLTTTLSLVTIPVITLFIL